jgi:tetratricopeptide (TPR) repeat protein
LDHNANIKRRVQSLIKKGSYAEAAASYEQLAEAGDMDPYDYVVLGDLLIRTGRRREAVGRYVEALNSYAEAGLNRNAIALAKKVRRLAADRHVIQRRLGDLYAAESLESEATLHYLEYLEKIDLKAEDAPDEVEHVCTRLLGLALPSFDVVDRLVETAKRVERQAKVAPGVLDQARRAAAVGEAEVEKRLTELALSLDAALDPSAPPSAEVEEPGANYLDPGAVHLTPSSQEPVPEAPAEPVEPAEPPVLSLDDFSYEDPHSVTLEASNGDSNGSGEEPAPAEPTPILAADLEADRAGTPSDADAGSARDEAPSADAGASDDDAGEGEEDPAALKARAFEFLEKNDPLRAQRELMRAARAYFQIGQSHEAGELYRRVVQLDPNHLEALRGLVELAHINGERGKMAHWGCELGDVLLAREMYPEAKFQFERVLAFDPENAKARSRVNRLNTIAGVEGSSFGTLAPDASEVAGAQVTVRNESPGGSQSAFDLSQILDEFREKVEEQIPEDDHRSHYDLGVSYKEMGLFAEAARAFETAAQGGEDRSRSLEMLAECYLLLERYSDAQEVIERVLPEVEGDAAARLRVQLGRVLEGMGEWDKAEDAYFQALELNENLLEAVELLESMEQRRERGAA